MANTIDVEYNDVSEDVAVQYLTPPADPLQALQRALGAAALPDTHVLGEMLFAHLADDDTSNHTPSEASPEQAKKPKKSKKSPKKSSNETNASRLRAFMARHKKLLIIDAIGVVVITLLALFIIKTAQPVHTFYTKSDHEVDAPVVIYLDQYLRSVDTAAATISPAVQGSWRHERKAPFGRDALIFTPSKHLVANTEYRIHFPRIERFAFGAPTLGDVTFRTQVAPSVEHTDTATLNDGARIAYDYAFTVRLKSKNRGLRKLELKTTPDIAMTTNVIDDQTFTWRPNADLAQGTPIEITLRDTLNNETLLTKKLQVVNEPKVASPVQGTRFTDGQTLTLGFSENMQPDASKSIEWSVEGDGSWSDAKTYVYKPKKLEPGKGYTYKVKAGVRSSEGGKMLEDFNGSFSALGSVYVTASSPRGNELPQASQTISFTFDQPVDHKSAEERFSVSSGTLEGFSWKGETLNAVVKNLGMQRTVTATIAPGVKNAGFGLPSVSPFSVSFTTEIMVVKLDVPYVRQAYAGSCTAASLKMALAYKGVGSDEMSLINLMGYAPRGMDKSSDPWKWDDPGAMFVGDVNGTNYDQVAGPDAPPVARAGRAMGAPAQSVTGIGANWIAEQIHAGKPVIFFGIARPGGKVISWQTPSGATARMHTMSHAKVITGVKGTPDAPYGFWINDPRYGQYYRTAAQINAEAAQDPYRQAVVVW